MALGDVSRIVIIGAGLAGDTAAAALREAGYAGAVTLVSDEAHLPYDRPPLSKAALMAPEEVKKIYFRKEGWYAEHDIELVLGDGAARLDAGAHAVTLRSGRELGYDKLLISTGTRARRLRMLEAVGAPVFYLRSLDDCEALRPHLQPGARIGIIGAGVIGMETAATATMLGCKVSVIEMADRVMARSVSPSVSAFIAAYHRQKGVDVLTGVKIAGVNGKVISLEGGPAIEVDAIIAGIGAEPITDLAQEAGLRVEDGIIVDRFTRTSDKDIFAAGDVARFESVVQGRHTRAEHWRHAIEQAKISAQAMLGGEIHYEEKPWVWSDQYDLNIQITGEGNAETEVLRGKIDDAAFTAFQLRAGRMVGAITVNNAKFKRQIADMVAANAQVDAAALADEQTDLKKYAKEVTQ